MGKLGCKEVWRLIMQLKYKELESIAFQWKLKIKKNEQGEVVLIGTWDTIEDVLLAAIGTYINLGR